MINKLTDRVYYMPHRAETDRPCLGLVRGDKFSLIVDSGNSPNHAREFLSELSSMNISPLKYLAITHYHEDHVFGIKEMKLTTIAHRNTEQKLAEMQKLKWDDASLEKYKQEGLFTEFTIDCIKKEIADRDNFVVGDLDMTIEGSLKIDLGGVSCIIEPVGGDHTEDSLIIYVPEEKVLFLGDCIYGSRYNGVYGYTTEKLFPMIDRIEKYAAEHYLISHEQLYDRNQLSELWNQLKTTGTIVGDDTSVEESSERFSVKLNRAPNKDEAFFIKCFADVNKERR